MSWSLRVGDGRVRGVRELGTSRMEHEGTGYQVRRMTRAEEVEALHAQQRRNRRKEALAGIAIVAWFYGVVWLLGWLLGG